MISCLCHQRALRRHLDDGEPLSPGAASHLEGCPSCREMIAAHLAIIEHLSAKASKQAPAIPPFLHARVMRGINEPASDQRSRPSFGWATAALVLAVAAISLIVFRERPIKQAVTWPVPTQIAFKAKLPENPLEGEIENLRADTLNAAKGLAATFMPSSDAR